MLGEKEFVAKLFYGFSLEKVVPEDDFYRKLEARVDLSWARPKVAHYFSDVGRPSIDPEVFAKIELIAYLEKICFERELMRHISDRLSLRRYIGYDIDEEVPDHSTLSKLRDRIGKEVMTEIFERSVRLCQEAGMVGGLHTSGDRSLMKANASMDSLVPREVTELPSRFVDRLFQENAGEGSQPKQDKPVEKPEPEAENQVQEAEPKHDVFVEKAQAKQDKPVEEGEREQLSNVVSLVNRPGYPTRLEVFCEKKAAAGLASAGQSALAESSEHVPVVGAPQDEISGKRQEPDESGTPIGRMPKIRRTVAGKGEAEDLAGGPGEPAGTGAGKEVGGTDKSKAPEERGAEGSSEESVEQGTQSQSAEQKTDQAKGKKKGEPPWNNATHYSRTDPDATIVTRPGKGTELAYGAEYFVDPRKVVITHADAFTGAEAEHPMVVKAVLEQREEFGLKIASLAWDKGAGRGRLYQDLEGIGVVPYIPHQAHANSTSGPGLYELKDFVYHEVKNVFVCPGGHELKYWKLHVEWPSVSHVWKADRKACEECSLKPKCTKAKKDGRSLQVNIYQKEYDKMDARLRAPGARLPAIARQVGPEQRFGEGKLWQGLERAKYRGLDKVRGQVLLTAAAQNIKKYLKEVFRRGSGAGAASSAQTRGVLFVFAPSLR